MTFIIWLFWYLFGLVFPSINPATEVILTQADGSGDKMKTLVSGENVTLNAELNGGYQEDSVIWTLSDDLNFDLDIDSSNPLRATVTYREDGDPNVATTVTFSCDADQDDDEQKMLVAATTIVGRLRDATIVELREEKDETEPSSENGLGGAITDLPSTQATGNSLAEMPSGLHPANEYPEQEEVKEPIDLNSPPDMSAEPYNYNPLTAPEEANTLERTNDNGETQSISTEVDTEAATVDGTADIERPSADRDDLSEKVVS